MITMLHAQTDQVIKAFTDNQVDEAVVYACFDCKFPPEQVEVFEGPDVEHANGVPLAAWLFHDPVTKIE